MSGKRRKWLIGLKTHQLRLCLEKQRVDALRSAPVLYVRPLATQLCPLVCPGSGRFRPQTHSCAAPNLATLSSRSWYRKGHIILWHSIRTSDRVPSLRAAPGRTAPCSKSIPTAISRGFSSRDNPLRAQNARLAKCATKAAFLFRDYPTPSSASSCARFAKTSLRAFRSQPQKDCYLHPHACSRVGSRAGCLFAKPRRCWRNAISKTGFSPRFRLPHARPQLTAEDPGASLWAETDCSALCLTSLPAESCIASFCEACLCGSDRALCPR